MFTSSVATWEIMWAVSPLDSIVVAAKEELNQHLNSGLKTTKLRHQDVIDSVICVRPELALK